MKTITQLSLTGVAVALLAAGSALAGDAEVRAIDNHHGTFTYLARAAQKETTVAVYHGRMGQGVGRAAAEANRDRGEFRQVTTPHGTVTYYAPAE